MELRTAKQRGKGRDEREIVGSLLRGCDGTKTKSIYLNGEEKWVGNRKKSPNETLLLPVNSSVTLIKSHKLSQAQTSQKGIIMPSSWEQGTD